MLHLAIAVKILDKNKTIYLDHDVLIFLVTSLKKDLFAAQDLF